MSDTHFASQDRVPCRRTLPEGVPWHARRRLLPDQVMHEDRPNNAPRPRLIEGGRRT